MNTNITLWFNVCVSVCVFVCMYNTHPNIFYIKVNLLLNQKYNNFIISRGIYRKKLILSGIIEYQILKHWNSIILSTPLIYTFIRRFLLPPNVCLKLIVMGTPKRGVCVCVYVSVWVCVRVSVVILSLFIEFLLYIVSLGPVGRVFANGPGDLDSIPFRVIPKTLKMVLDTSLLNIQQYKVRIRGKVEQSRERSSALPYTSVW